MQVLLSPIVGYSIDRWGHRFHYVALAPILWVTAAGLLGFSSVHPLVALVFASLAGSINGAPLREQSDHRSASPLTHLRDGNAFACRGSSTDRDRFRR